MLSRNRWITFLFAVCIAGSAQARSENAQTSNRNLNPYHEQQLREQIEKCASGVLACTDGEVRSMKQQELCQLLIRAERHDEALQVANNIYKTDQADKERRAAHHFLLAEIYNRKMKASRTLDEMEKNRQFALSAAQEVVEQKYPSKWGVSEHARALIRQLNDTNTMTVVRQRVASRQGTGDSAKEAIADAQRKYLDATQGGSGANAPSTAHFRRVMPETQQEATSSRNVTQGTVQPPSQTSISSLPTQPAVSRVVSPVKYESSAAPGASDRLNRSGLLTSQPTGPRTSIQPSINQPILVNGTAVTNVATGKGGGDDSSVDSIVQNNLETLLEAARKRKENSRSPYATGQLPTNVR